MIPSLPCLRATSRSALNPKRLQTGLYDGRSIQSGNAIGETFNSKTRRTWLPNAQTKTVWSEALGQRLKLKVTAGALRTIDKVGGLDAYLFRMDAARLGAKGMALRKLVRSFFCDEGTRYGQSADGRWMDVGGKCTCGSQGGEEGAVCHAVAE
jgi:large subunit ribosomal protein L28